ncbi:hypothetical protein Poly24_21510 [Rosistilla carotiformis]|uniref:Probable sensor domain-containing protein n=1 Tax=Rosistilla carotiformis TaxID=2528017 RepID=A0A518JSC0_9BACT|nr:diadenylate cyclase [Rosistilla carotiformis]QDV68442.1 hypothetical protein Poly24_21510 [Rosistilla carotiformis]
MTSIASYPVDIAAALEKRWAAKELPADALPCSDAVIRLIDTMYQASLLREEGNGVRCRLIVGPPSDFVDQLSSGASQLHVLRFTEPRDFTPHQLRKLAAAAGYYRALLAVDFDVEGTLSIWGMVITGTDWVNRVEGERAGEFWLPVRPVIHCVGPGHLIVAAGYNRILESSGGKLLTDGFDPFRSSWLSHQFRLVRTSLIEELAQLEPDDSTTRMCDTFVKDIAQSIVRRVLHLVRTRGHGGMLVFLPNGLDTSPLIDRWFRFRVRFEGDDSTLRFRRLIVNLMQQGRRLGEARGIKEVTWEHYLQMRHGELAELDAALIEFGHFLADLMSADGSLVVDRSFRLIGFGAEILGDSHVTSIHRAFDLEAINAVPEPADSSGTRHRSAYRLVSGLRETIAVVVSQDGDVRFVAHHKDKLTYWPYLP